MEMRLYQLGGSPVVQFNSFYLSSSRQTCSRVYLSIILNPENMPLCQSLACQVHLHSILSKLLMLKPGKRIVVESLCEHNARLARLWRIGRDQQLDRYSGQVCWEEHRQNDSIQPTQRLSRQVSTIGTPCVSLPWLIPTVLRKSIKLGLFLS